MENTNHTGESPVIEFSARALAPIAMFKAQMDIRYYLNGICVQPNKNGPGCFIIGCDGHRLAIWHDKDGTCSRQMVLAVSRELVSASRKKAAKDGRVCLEAGRLVVRGRTGDETFVQAGKAEVEVKDGMYPDIWRVVPPKSKLQPGLRGAIQGRYIEDLGKAAKLLEEGGKYGHGCGVWHFSSGETSRTGYPSGSVLTRFANANNFVVITMPMREDGVLMSALPDAFVGKVPVEVSAPATVLYPMGSMGDAL